MIRMEAGAGLVAIGLSLAVASFILLALGASEIAPYAFYAGAVLAVCGWCLVSWSRRTRPTAESEGPSRELS